MNKRQPFNLGKWVKRAEAKQIEPVKKRLELLPCPFCGGEPQIGGPDNPAHEFWVYCHECSSGPSRTNKERAIVAWNTRVPANKQPDDNELLKRFAIYLRDYEGAIETPPSFYASDAEVLVQIAREHFSRPAVRGSVFVEESEEA